MKSDTTNTILNLLLAALALAGVVLALRTISLTRELHSFQMAVPEKNYLLTVESMAKDAKQYEKTHPDISPILAPIEPKQAKPVKPSK